MDSHNIPNITSQQIQIFIKAVELRNFTKVANYLNYTPSMISKTIASLEDELGIKLFTRKPHELVPTPAASMLAKEWRHFIASFTSSITRARAYQKELESQIVLGFVDSSDQVDKMISSAIKKYSSRHPEIRITAEKHDMHRSAELLNSGMLDVILTSETEVPYLDSHDLMWEKTVDTHVAVYVPRTNALFNRDSIDIHDLKNQELLSLDPMMHPTYSEWMFGFCADKGFVPNVIATFRTVRSLRFSLNLMDAVFIGDSINADWCNDDLKQFILPDKSFTLVACRRESTEAIKEFKDYLKSIYPSEL
ncbi:MAG: LysR family transcriptional regulator [Clostridiales bacterium]|nr:LysR family transcriptional regulator [Clostridiales bacterium]